MRWRFSPLILKFGLAGCAARILVRFAWKCILVVAVLRWHRTNTENKRKQTEMKLVLCTRSRTHLSTRLSILHYTTLYLYCVCVVQKWIQARAPAHMRTIQAHSQLNSCPRKWCSYCYEHTNTRLSVRAQKLNPKVKKKLREKWWHRDNTANTHCAPNKLVQNPWKLRISAECVCVRAIRIWIWNRATNVSEYGVVSSRCSSKNWKVKIHHHQMVAVTQAEQ